MTKQKVMCTRSGKCSSDKYVNCGSCRNRVLTIVIFGNYLYYLSSYRKFYFQTNTMGKIWTLAYLNEDWKCMHFVKKSSTGISVKLYENRSRWIIELLRLSSCISSIFQIFCIKRQSHEFPANRRPKWHLADKISQI